MLKGNVPELKDMNKSAYHNPAGVRKDPFHHEGTEQQRYSISS
jgi:hypothetical protein